MGENPFLYIYQVTVLYLFYFYYIFSLAKILFSYLEFYVRKILASEIMLLMLLKRIYGIDTIILAVTL